MKPPLRLVTCGSVDDGKSTLIGRLLLQSNQLLDDQLESIKKASARFGTQGSSVDLALALDGLQAEREQGITIDVAYRSITTAARRLTVADTPGHEQYTRNMATAASTAQLALILIDSRNGVMVQTRRHSRIAAMLGVRHVVLAINKMDLIAWGRTRYEQIVDEYRTFAAPLNFASAHAIPLSALTGDNVTSTSPRAGWYQGPALLEYLETVDVEDARPPGAFHLPVQYVNRPNPEFRGFCGRVASGEIHRGDVVTVSPGGMETRVKSIVVYGGQAARAVEGESVTLTLDREVDVSRGDVISSAGGSAHPADQFQAQVIWLNEQPLVPGRSYLLKIHANVTNATITAIKHRVDIDTGAHIAAKSLNVNEIAVVNVSLNRRVLIDSYGTNRQLGAFILIDRMTNATVGAGVIDFVLRRADNIHWQALSIDKGSRAQLKGQSPVCIWLTGLSGAGKSTIADLLEKRLHAEGYHTYLMDGDNVRHGLNRDLGFVEADRTENIRRVAEVARLMVDAGLIVIVALISPYRTDRQLARSLFGEGEFLEVYVDASVDECAARDPKGLYAKARRGELKNFTGIDSRYEPPLAPAVHLATTVSSPIDCVDKLMGLVVGRHENKLR